MFRLFIRSPLVAHELHSNQVIKLWSHELFELSSPPYSMGKDALFIAYYATAKFSCHLSMGWELPVNVLDLFVEFRNFTNGKKLKGYGFQMFSATFMFLPSLLGTTLNDTAKDIMFVLGVLIITECV